LTIAKRAKFKSNDDKTQIKRESGMHILITIGVCVLCVGMPCYAQDTGAGPKASSKNEKIGEPVKNETGLKGLLGGGSLDTKDTADEKPPADTSSASMSERIIVEEREVVDELEDDDDLHYLDEDHDE
jgi:hypothetical protein